MRVFRFRSSLYSLSAAAWVLLSSTGIACKTPQATADSVDRYEFTKDSTGKTLRLDRVTGEVTPVESANTTAQSPGGRLAHEQPVSASKRDVAPIPAAFTEPLVRPHPPQTATESQQAGGTAE